MNSHRDTGTLNAGRDGSGVVVVFSCTQRAPEGHEYRSHAEIARRLAAIKGFEFAGEFDPACRYGCPVYFVPSDTLVGGGSAQALGVTSEHDLFGGVVPFPFIATKAITHGLPGEDARAPEGWSAAFARAVSDVVLPGYSAFSEADARSAGRILLERGRVRVKRTTGMGGMGQQIVQSGAELEACLAALDAGELQHSGVALESNLSSVRTYSVGQTRVDDLLISYCGTQQLTMNNHGEEVYGGSRLLIARGDFDALLGLKLDDAVRTAIRQACIYHAAAIACYPGFFASRSNYDVAQGVDDTGQWHSGVLEQSWRVGGASAAEVAALAVFRADPSIRAVRASTAEVYGSQHALPREAVLHYQGIDEQVGALTKYSLVERHADA